MGIMGVISPHVSTRRSGSLGICGYYSSCMCLPAPPLYLLWSCDVKPPMYNNEEMDMEVIVQPVSDLYPTWKLKMRVNTCSNFV